MAIIFPKIDSKTTPLVNELTSDDWVVGHSATLNQLARFSGEALAANAAGGRGSIMIDGANLYQGHNINHGLMFEGSFPLTDCHYEIWARPLTNGLGWLGYLISMNYGGLHESLIGVQAGETIGFVTGNYHDGLAHEFTSLDPFYLDEWVHMSMTWHDTLKKFYIHVFGVLSNIISFPGLTRTAQGHSVMFAGGSDHINAFALLHGIEFYEKAGSAEEYRQNFVPMRQFVGFRAKNDFSGFKRASFSVMYDRDLAVFEDISEGYESIIGDGKIKHHGFLNFGKDQGNGSPAVSGQLPWFVAGEIPVKGTSFPAAPATPNDALVFDSASRINKVPAFDDISTPGNPTTDLSWGSTETGSLGPKVWQGSAGCGILYGRFFVPYQSPAFKYLTLDRTDIHLSIKRMNNSVCYTGLLARYEDDDNCITVTGTPTSINIIDTAGGVVTDSDTFVISDYEKIDLKVNGTLAEVYADNVLIGTLPITVNGSVNHGAYANVGLDVIWRGDDWTAFAVIPDITPPSVPAMTAATGITDTEINWNWNASTDDIAVTGYDLQVAEDAGFTVNLRTINLGNVLTYSDTGLDPATQYFARARAHDGAPNYSAYSSSVNATTDAAVWSPADVFRNWWPIEALSGLANNDPVLLFEDQINAVDFTAAGSVAPIYKTNGGDPYIEFDGIDDVLLATTGGGDTDLAMFFIVNVLTLGADFTRIFDAANVAVYTLNASSGTLQFGIVGGGPSDDTLPAVPTGFMAVYCERTGTDGKLRRDGAETTFAVGVNGTGAAFRLGGSGAGENKNMQLKEFGFLDRPLTAPEFAELATYILSRPDGLTI